jgi:hypothetical protein
VIENRQAIGKYQIYQLVEPLRPGDLKPLDQADKIWTLEFGCVSHTNLIGRVERSGLCVSEGTMSI